LDDNGFIVDAEILEVEVEYIAQVIDNNNKKKNKYNICF
jgi:hypothetical protein